jgi:wobble nucleotide-excising tRNase
VSFAQSLNEYFDEAFLQDTQKIESLVSDYAIEAQRVQFVFANIIANPSRFLDLDKVKVESELFESKIVINNQRLTEKKKETSHVITLETLQNVANVIKVIIDNANTKIEEHNNIVANLATERKLLISQVWRFILDEFKDKLNSYKKEKGNLSSAISNLEDQIGKNNETKQQKKSELKDLERQTTSIQPTIDGINDLLAKFGFQSFRLDKSPSGSSYRIIRLNGVDAKATLSEGEKTFVCFIYFYYLLKGSNSESGITTNRIVVIDDPVSSLDSDVLFIVSSLIKGLFNEVRNGQGNLKQIFILTHNVYFHKEITFNIKRRNGSLTEESFWILRKMGSGVKIESYDDNPIKTSYDLLWAEVRSDTPSLLTIQNTLRKILENYFKILGGIDFDEICEHFSGSDKLICNSLFSWVNDGSHFAQDDLYISLNETQLRNYLRVFREIFEKTDNMGHYKMMMGDAFTDNGLSHAP